MADHAKRIKNIVKIKTILNELHLSDNTFNLVWRTDHEVAKILDELKELKGGNSAGKEKENKEERN